MDRATALEYKKESNRWRIRTVSLYAAFPQGTTLATAGAPAVASVVPCGNAVYSETVRILQRLDSFLYSRAVARSKSRAPPTSRPLRPGILEASS